MYVCTVYTCTVRDSALSHCTTLILMWSLCVCGGGGGGYVTLYIYGGMDADDVCNTPHLRAASPSPPPPPAASAGRSRHARAAAPCVPAGHSAAAGALKWWAGWHRSQRPPAHAPHPSPAPLQQQEQEEEGRHLYIHMHHSHIRTYIVVRTYVCTYVHMHM